MHTPELINTYLQNPTVEGDNYVLPQQTAKVLLRLLEEVVRGGEGVGEWRGTDAAYLVRGVGGAEGGGEVKVPDGVIGDLTFLLEILRKR